eukprot:3377107-Rhodomonas_salina.11
MPGTNIAYGAICLRTRYAMSGTDVAYGTICLRPRYAVPGTDPGNAGTRELWYWSTRCLRY